MTKPQHIHKLKRLKYKSGNTIFFCSLPDCTFKTNISLVLGKRSLCWRCGAPFLMSEYSLRLAKPHCEACHKPKNEEVPFHNQNATTELWDGANPLMPDDKPSLSLSERLQQTLRKPKQIEEEEI